MLIVAPSDHNNVRLLDVHTTHSVCDLRPAYAPYCLLYKLYIDIVLVCTDKAEVAYGILPNFLIVPTILEQVLNDEACKEKIKIFGIFILSHPVSEKIQF